VSFDPDRQGEPILVTLAESLQACMPGTVVGKSGMESQTEEASAKPVPKNVKYERAREMKARQRKEAKK
jgi:hypothetical protein